MAALLLIVALLLFQVPAFGQYAGGSLTALVTDATGAIIPNAKVVLKNEATNATREAATNSSGYFSFQSIQPGSYTVTVSSAGLASWEQRNIEMTQGISRTLPKIILQVATTKEQVVVMGISEAIAPIESSQASQTLGKNMIEELSIVGRDAAELIKIMPGMANNRGLNNSMWNSYTTATNTGPIGDFSAAGTQPHGAITMTSDGANLLDPGNQGTQTANINQNQVAEVTILTSAYGAEFAKGPVTFQAYGKSGGATFHGGAYLYARHGTFNAIDYFNKIEGVGSKPDKPKPIDKFYYPGGDIGGPVILPGTNFNRNRDKLFFYTAFEYMKQQPAGQIINYFVPTEEMKAGNFSPAHLASLGTSFANARSAANVVPGGNATSNDGVQFPGGMIPASQLDPNSKILLGLFPKSNTDVRTSLTGSNYQFLNAAPQNRWEYRVRGDYNISERTKLFFSWNTQRERTESPISIWWNIPGSLPYPSNQVANQTANIYNANLVHVFSPTLTNEFVFSKARFLNPVHLTDPDKVNPDKLGFKMNGLFANPFDPQIPNTFGWNNSNVGFATYPYGAPWPAGGSGAFGKLSDTPNISDNVSWVKNTHTVKAGFYYDFARNNQTGGGLDWATQGAANYENWGARSSGNPIADYIMARPSAFNQLKDAAVADFKYHQYSFYVQDAWKTTRRLTLTLGLRFDHLGNWVPGSGPGLAVWDQSKYNNTATAPAWTGLAWNAIDKSVPMSGFPSRPFFYEPRFGAAYDLFGTGKTVLRGGAGLYRYQLAYNSVSGDTFAAPLNIPRMGTEWGCCVGWTSFNQYAPTTTGIPGRGSPLNGILTKGDDRTPYTWTFNFTISQRLPWQSVMELQYSGNRSRDQMLRGELTNINAVPWGAFFKANPKTGQIMDPAAGGFPANDYRPMANYQDVTLVGHGSYANYNSLVATWQKQAGRVNLTANYTFGKVLGIRDDNTDNGTGAGETIYRFGLRENYGVLNFDHTHIFNAAYVINLPDATRSRLMGGLVNGWTLSGITQWQSGAPIQPNTNGALNVQWPGSYGAQQYLGTTASDGPVPRLTCDPRKNLSDGQYFNPNCFAPPVGGKDGDYIWPYIKGPAFFNSDLAVYKNFRVAENQKLQFRFSAFNFLNHPLPDFAAGGNSDINLNFQNPNGTLSQTNLNALTNGKTQFKVGRRLIEFTVKYNF